jgi:hypothetical protein
MGVATRVPGSALSAGEAAELGRLERIIEAGRPTYLKVSLALSEIRSRRLYRNFEEYVSARWGMSRQHAHRIIAAGRLAKSRHEAGELPPTSERHARRILAESRAKAEHKSRPDSEARWQHQAEALVKKLCALHTDHPARPKLDDLCFRYLSLLWNPAWPNRSPTNA